MPANTKSGTNKMKIRKGDLVEVLTGKDRGKRGEVITALPADRKVIVDGVNVAKKHQKPRSATMQGGIIDKDMPLPVANVALVCDDCGPTRVGYRFDDDGTKVRVCKKCRKDLD
jgi:large subunit ribosomal protein L24